MNISALIIARDEEDKIESTLLSLSFVDEIVVVLDRSTDKTSKICKKFTKQIYRGSWVCEGKRRNFGIQKCRSKWILEIDADEIVTKPLANEIIKKIKSEDCDYFYIPLVNYINSIEIKYGWMACLAPDGKFSLFKKKNKKWDMGLVHPSYQIYGKKGKIFNNHIQHFMSKNISELLKRFNRNSSLYAKELRENKKNITKLFSIRKIFSRFLKSYISRMGYKSGVLGLLVCILNAIYPIVSAVKSVEDRTIDH